MSILTISSTNPNLSHILYKNPNTITESGKPFERDVRKGRVYGWFSNSKNSTFRLLFIDSPVDNSFGESEFEYLDTARYDNPYVPIAVMTAALSSALKTKHELDTEDFTTLVISNVKIPLRIIERFAKLKGFTVLYREIVQGHYKVCVTANSVADALNLFQIICFVACLADADTYVPLPEAAVEKYISSLNRIDAPYFARYLVSSRALNNRTSFAKLEPKLSTDTIKLQFGDTQMQRHDAISSVLDGGETLVDIGCGEMYHSLKMGKNYKTVICIDENEEIHTQNSGKINRRMLSEKMTSIHANVDQNWVDENEVLLSDADVLISECLEHIHQPNAEDLVKALLKSPAKRIAITVPNKAFNVHYGMKEDDIRHPDHLWEPTFKEWSAFVGGLGLEPGVTEKWTSKTVGIGDCVDNHHVSSMTTFIRKT